MHRNDLTLSQEVKVHAIHWLEPLRKHSAASYSIPHAKKKDDSSITDDLEEQVHCHFRI